MAEGAPTRVIITGGTTEAPPPTQSFFGDPSLYPSIDSAIFQAHMVSRPDLVRLDENGNVKEIATVIVNGKTFEDWETVWIQWDWISPYSQFRFTCAEREPYPTPGGVLQFEPGHEVEIYLGGIQVISGVIITRQVAYDADKHIVQLQGVSISWFANRSSIDHKTGDFNGKSFLQIAREILKPTGVTFETRGIIDETPFESGATQSHGEPIGQFLERLARMRKIIISNTPDGKYLFVGEHSSSAQAELVEGINIKKMQCVITIEAAYQQYIWRGQSKANNQKNMTTTSEQEARVSGFFPRYSVLIGAAEHPVWSTAELMTRAQTEKMWNEDLTKIDATVTVYGWFRPLPTTTMSWAVQQLGPTTGHTIWQAGDEVVVHSPMAMLYHQHLKIRTVTWMQDSQNGSQTILNLTTPQGLNGRPVPMPRADGSDLLSRQPTDI